MAGSTSLYARLRHAILLSWACFLSLLRRPRSSGSLHPLLPVAGLTPFRVDDSEPPAIRTNSILRCTAEYPSTPSHEPVLRHPITHSSLKAAAIAFPGLVYLRAGDASGQRPARQGGRLRVRFEDQVQTIVEAEDQEVRAQRDAAIARFQAMRAECREQRQRPISVATPSISLAAYRVYPTRPELSAATLCDLLYSSAFEASLPSPVSSQDFATSPAATDPPIAVNALLASSAESSSRDSSGLSSTSSPALQTPPLPAEELLSRCESAKLAFSFDSSADIVISPLQFEFNALLVPFHASHAPSANTALRFTQFEVNAVSAFNVGLADDFGPLATHGYPCDISTPIGVPLTSTPRMSFPLISTHAAPVSKRISEAPSMARIDALSYAEFFDWSIYDRPVSVTLHDVGVSTSTGQLAPLRCSPSEAVMLSSPPRALNDGVAYPPAPLQTGSSAKENHVHRTSALPLKPSAQPTHPLASASSTAESDHCRPSLAKYELLLAGIRSPALGGEIFGSQAASAQCDIRISAVLGELQCAYEHLSMREWDENQFRRVFA